MGTKNIYNLAEQSTTPKLYVTPDTDCNALHLTHEISLQRQMFEMRRRSNPFVSILLFAIINTLLQYSVGEKLTSNQLASLTNEMSRTLAHVRSFVLTPVSTSEQDVPEEPEANDRRVLATTETIKESFNCGHFKLDDDDVNCGQTSTTATSRAVRACAPLVNSAWDCSSNGPSCTSTLSAAFVKCLVNKIIGEGYDSSTCEIMQDDIDRGKQKSDSYHGLISENDCEMNDNKILIHDEWICGENGAYFQSTLTIQDGGDPTSCTETAECITATQSRTALSCTIKNSATPPPFSFPPFSSRFPSPPPFSFMVPSTVTRSQKDNSGRIIGFVIGAIVFFAGAAFSLARWLSRECNKKRQEVVVQSPGIQMQQPPSTTQPTYFVHPGSTCAQPVGVPQYAPYAHPDQVPSGVQPGVQQVSQFVAPHGASAPPQHPQTSVMQQPMVHSSHEVPLQTQEQAGRTVGVVVGLPSSSSTHFAQHAQARVDVPKARRV